VRGRYRAEQQAGGDGGAGECQGCFSHG
jgi:hypothetical protein